MFSGNQQGNLGTGQTAGPFQKLWYQLGTVIAGIATILVLPQIWDLTHQWVFDYSLENYGSRDAAHFVHLIYGGFLTALIFLVLRAVAVLTLMAIAEAVLFRFLV